MNVKPKVVHQGQLEHLLRCIFPQENFITNATKQGPIKDPSTRVHLELDVYFPHLKLGFEFQDIHHFGSAWYYHSSLASVQSRDRHKVDIANSIGLSLLQVPCWWDSTIESLTATISFYRPDLVDHRSNGPSPIPLNHPVNYLSGGSIPKVGELMLASFPSNAAPLEQVISPEISWWMGEKYDGVRFCWNTEHVYSRSGLELLLPQSIIATMRGDVFLDGELWFGRGSFLESQQLVHPTHHINWATLRAIVFDEPDPCHSTLPFESRYANIMLGFTLDHPTIVAAPRMSCPSLVIVSTIISDLIDHQGAEGVVLRQSYSSYVSGRSSSLLKLKKYRGDSEALVVRVVPSFAVLQLPSGITMKAALGDTSVIIPQRGDVITFSFTSCSQWAVPLDPKICRIRRDLSWNDVVNSTAAKSGVGIKKRLELEKVAKKHDKDPLLPTTWYSLIHELRGRLPSGTIVQALLRLFPEIGLDKSKFPNSSQHKWRTSGGRRRFLCKVARQNGFDPLVAQNWYSFTYNNVKGMSSLVKYYNGSIARTLVHLFPEIGVDSERFPVPREHWKDLQNRKDLFLKFAAVHRFDPLVPENWYSTPTTGIHKFKGMRAVLEYYDDIPDALMQLFPTTGLRRDRFASDFPRNHWKSVDNRREFFCKFARDNSFDPLMATNWYSVSAHSISSQQGSESVLRYNNANIGSALMEAFPDIGLMSNKFLGNRNAEHLPRDYWKESENQSSFFIKFATRNGFDPLVPANWQSISTHQLLQVKGVGSVLAHHNNSITQALAHFFTQQQCNYLNSKT